MTSLARPVLVLAAAMLLVTGCESMKDIGQEIGVTEGETASVSVPFPELGEPVTVLVTASTNDQSKQGVRLLKIQEFAQAESVLQSAVATDPKDHRSYFALGVAREMTGDTKAAKQAYVTAISLNSEQREYTQALNRVKMKLGED